MFHSFPELGPQPCLVRATELDYADAALPLAIEDELRHQGSTRFGSFVRSVTQSGFVRDETRPAVVLDGVSFLTYRKASLLPLEFEYSKAVIETAARDLEPASAANLPEGVDGERYRFVDLDGEGIAGVLGELARSTSNPELGRTASRAADYWRRISRFERARLNIYAGRTAFSRARLCVRLIGLGGYRPSDRGGLGWRLLLKDVLVGLLRLPRNATPALTDHAHA